jgi:hypothetical protein
VASGGDDWFTFYFKHNLPASATYDPYVTSGSGHGWISSLKNIESAAVHRKLFLV